MQSCLLKCFIVYQFSYFLKILKGLLFCLIHVSNRSRPFRSSVCIITRSSKSCSVDSITIRVNTIKQSLYYPGKISRVVGLGNISILPLQRNTMMCNTDYCSYFENTAILCVHYYCTFTHFIIEKLNMNNECFAKAIEHHG